MKPLKFALMSTLPVALFVLGACSSSSPEVESSTSILLETDTGATVVDTFTVGGTVTAVDTATRKVTLAFPDGTTKTYHVGQGAINFDRIKAGDVVKAQVTEEFAVYLRKAGTPASVGEGMAVALAPKGAMPGGYMADTRHVTASIVSVDSKRRRVTLQFPDGSSQTLRVGKYVTFSDLKPGDAVEAQVSESLALSVEAS
jgi:exosome complex RNA-binding protein Csl4